jgi:DNA-binding XRE family transcriptional regulator
MINEKLKSLRVENGLTRAHVAKELKTYAVGIQLLEEGTLKPNHAALRGYCNLFNCTIKELTS